MNNWKDAPHIFANGKFYIDAEPLTSIEMDLYEFDGFVGEIIGIKNNHNGEIIDHIQLSPNECTLIARKIENMTDDEVIEMTQSDPVNARDYLKEGTLNGGILSGRYLLHLLSIGVYPFDQSHFESGIVIDMKTLK